MKSRRPDRSRWAAAWLVIFFAVGASTPAFAKRSAPKDVPPLVIDDLKLVSRYQHAATGGHAFVEAVAVGDPTPDPWFAADEPPHRFRWRAEVYAVTYEPKLETDVQDDYIASLERHGSQVWIVSERGHRYALDLASHRVSPR